MPFVIRHKSTGNLFPCIVSRGQTFLEFEPPRKRAPRLWTTRKAAQGFLTLWCKGPLCAEYEESIDGLFGLSETKFKGWKGDLSMAKNSRIPDEYEVLEAHVTFLGSTAL